MIGDSQTPTYSLLSNHYKEEALNQPQASYILQNVMKFWGVDIHQL